MPTLELANGLTMHYLDDNQPGSPSVLLLHGLGATGESWQLQIPPLTDAGFHILAPDARGFGHSTFNGGSPSIAEMTADFASLLKKLDIESAHVVGISMGGTHALQFALDYPQLVEKLVLVNTFANLRPENLSGWLYFALRFVLVNTLGLETQAKTVVKRIFPRPEQEELRTRLIEQILMADPQGYRTAMRALARFDVRDRLNEVQAPTLVITGENDTTVPFKNQKALAEGIPGARQVIIPAGGHAVTVDQPDVFNRILLDFLTE